MDGQSYLERDVKISSIGGPTHHFTAKSHFLSDPLVSHNMAIPVFLRNCINLEGKTKQGGYVFIHVNTFLKNIFVYIYVFLKKLALNLYYP